MRGSDSKLDVVDKRRSEKQVNVNPGKVQTIGEMEAGIVRRSVDRWDRWDVKQVNKQRKVGSISIYAGKR